MKEKLHTADHIVCTILETKYKIKTKGMEFGEDSCRMEFECETDLRPLKEEIEKDVNQVIEQDLDVISYTLPKQEAEKITDVSLIPADVTEVTIYEIKGFCKLACAGPHVKKTKEVGKFEIIKIKKKGSGKYSIKYTVK